MPVHERPFRVPDSITSDTYHPDVPYKDVKVPLLPRTVYQMCVHGGLIVGSQAKKLAGDDVDVSSSDWDLLIPYARWQVIALMIPEDAFPNKFGGWRFYTGVNEEVDVWPGDLAVYLRECKTKHGGNVYAVDYINNMVYSSQVRDLSQ